jgi:hypothetical protein
MYFRFHSTSVAIYIIIIIIVSAWSYYVILTLTEV